KKKKDVETAEERKARIEHRRSQKKRKADTETNEEREERLARECNRKRKGKDVEVIRERETLTEHNHEQLLKASADGESTKDVPQELQGLTNSVEMLIAQVFPIISVYNLREGQYAYRENIINFSQDIQGFVIHFSHHPSLFDIFIIRRPSFNGSTFQDFQVRREK
ncbi:17766_t:CDS:2, partial [Racocetra persica]